MSETSTANRIASPVEVNHDGSQKASTGVGTAPPWKSRLQRYHGMAYVLAAEIFGAGMIGTARMLQNGTESKPGMATVQVSQNQIFVRCPS